MVYWVFLFELAEVFPLCPNWHYTHCWNGPVVYRMWCLSLVCHELWWTKTVHSMYGFAPNLVGEDFDTWGKLLDILSHLAATIIASKLKTKLKGSWKKESPIESPFWFALLFMPHLPFVIFDFHLDKIIDLLGVYIYPSSIYMCVCMYVCIYVSIVGVHERCNHRHKQRT